MALDRKSTTKGDFEATVLSNQQIRTCYCRLTLELEPAATSVFGTVNPGQFAMLDLTDTSLPPPQKIPENLKDPSKRQIILRRPFSFSDVSIHHSDHGSVVRLEIMYCVLGPATIRMTSLSKGDTIRILGPLGNGFDIQPQKELAILIAGGMGSPPMIHLAGVLKTRFPDMRVVIFVGAKSCDSLPFTVHIGNKTGLVLEEFQQLNVVSCYVATDDGSAGFKGFITGCLDGWLAQNNWTADKTIFYACGPEPMLAAAAGLARKYNVDCQVSMERMMACGIGLCQSCAVEHKAATEGQTEYHLCCQDGPVFDASKVIFGSEHR